MQGGVQSGGISVRVEQSLVTGMQRAELSKRAVATYCERRRLINPSAPAKNRHEEVFSRGSGGDNLATRVIGRIDENGRRRGDGRCILIVDYVAGEQSVACV